MIEKRIDEIWKEFGALIKTYYGEGLFISEQDGVFSENMEKEIRSALGENHGVGLWQDLILEDCPSVWSVN